MSFLRGRAPVRSLMCDEVLPTVLAIGFAVLSMILSAVIIWLTCFAKPAADGGGAAVPPQAVAPLPPPAFQPPPVAPLPPPAFQPPLPQPIPPPPVQPQPLAPAPYAPQAFAPPPGQPPVRGSAEQAPRVFFAKA